MNYLHNKTIIITGASSGIGAAAAKALAAHGAKLVLAARDQDRLDALVGEIRASGGTAAARIADVTDSADMEALAQYAVETFGGVDILVNNAGLMLFSAWKDLAVNDWGRMIDTNIRGYLNGIQAVLPIMLERQSGYILNMASVAGHQIGDSAGVYSATKFFVRAITESMRKELGVATRYSGQHYQPRSHRHRVGRQSGRPRWTRSSQRAQCTGHYSGGRGRRRGLCP